CDLICQAYQEQEFKMLLFVHVADFDFAGLPNRYSYKDKVFETVTWALRVGEAKQVLWLARLVSRERPQHQALGKLVLDLQNQVERQVLAPAGNAAGEPLPLPPDLATSLALLEAKPQELAADLRPKLRATSYKPLEIPDRFHLSVSEGRRLVAVLAL